MAARRRNTVAELERWEAQLGSGDEIEREAATAALIEAFEPLATEQVRWYRSLLPHEDHDDLMQIARVGLLVACQTYDAQKAGGTFAPHATWCIRHELWRAACNLSSGVRLPSKLMNLMGKLHRFIIDFEREHGVTPGADVVAQKLEISVYDACVVIGRRGGNLTMSMNTSFSGDTARESFDLVMPQTAGYSPEDLLIANEERNRRKR